MVISIAIQHQPLLWKKIWGPSDYFPQIGDLIFLCGYCRNSLNLKVNDVIRICLNIDHFVSRTYSSFHFWKMSLNFVYFSFTIILVFFFKNTMCVCIIFQQCIFIFSLESFFSHSSLLCILFVFITVVIYALLCFQLGLYLIVLLSVWCSILQQIDFFF